MGEVFLDAFLDALKLLPFLFLLYILIELLEHKTKMGHPVRLLTGKAAPFLGAATGLIPMCGFSVMAGKLYEKKYLTLGTLFAVFIATSDEALLVLALSGLGVLEKLYTILALLGSKLVLGAGVGYAVDLIFRSKPAPMSDFVPIGEHGGTHEEGEHVHGDADGAKEPAVCEHKHENRLTLYLFSPLLHALEVAGVVLVLNLLFGLLFHLLGEERVLGFLQGAGLWYQPIVTALVGLVPNCFSSVALAEVYAVGGISFGSLLGGLVTNAGLGVTVLFRNTKAWKRNLLVLAATFLLGVLFGYAASAIEILI